MAVDASEHAAQQAYEAERALLGALLLDSAVGWPQVKDVVDLSHFSRVDHRLIFSAISSVIEHGQPADPVLVLDRLADDGKLEAAGGKQYIVDLYAETGSAANAAAYAKIVRRHASRGKVVDIADVLAAKARSLPVDDALRFAQEQLERVRREHSDEDKTPVWPPPLNLVSLLAVEPAKPRMIINDWLPSGYAAMLAGHGGAGKSSTALHLAAAIAQGRAWYGLSTAQRRVVYLSCEDRVDVIHWRLARICEREGWRAADIADRLLIRDLVGYEAILYRSSFDGLQPTKGYAELARIMQDDPSAVLIVDGVSDTYGGNENDRGQVKTFVNALVRLVNADGAVLLVHHVNKQSANATTGEGYSGSTGWHNSVRARWYLRPEMENDEEGNRVRADGKLVLELQKTNHGRADQQIPLRWDDDAHLFVPDGEVSRVDASIQATEERAGIVRALRDILSRGGHVPTAAQGPRTTLHVLQASPEFPKSLQNRGGKRRFWRHIEDLRRIGTISVGSIRRENRHITEVFTVGNQGAP